MRILYTVVRASSHENLATEVNLRLAQGWRLIGGVAVSNGLFYQAMILEG